uniref:Uncharacterized protein n=1 Tax=Caenorhabditis japonica TaxID=281687 RepID=A0A8R1HZY7_CAEJA
MVSKRILVLLLVTVGLVSAGMIRRRRDNTYGDEAVTPAGGGASAAPLVAELPSVTVAHEGEGSQSNVESSGYRKKRGTSQNGYGDEAAAPAGGGAPVADVSEAPAVTVEQSGGSQSAVSSSGY